MANVEDASCSIMMSTPTKEWDYILYPELMLCQISSQAILQMQANTDESQESFSHNNRKFNKIRVRDTILAAVS